LGQFPVCSSCRAGNAEFDRARAWGLYEGSLRRVIREFKFGGCRRLGVPLAGLLRETLKSFELTVEYIVPVPSHRARIRARGFDQIRALTKKLSFDTGIAIFDGLTRIRDTKPQFGLPLRERSRNVKGAFRLKDPEVLENRKVLILDDIITTGATVQEISRMLNSEGKPAWMGVLTVARAARRYPL
jgi:competence protein ComFC